MLYPIVWGMLIFHELSHVVGIEYDGCKSLYIDYHFGLNPHGNTNYTCTLTSWAERDIKPINFVFKDYSLSFRLNLRNYEGVVDEDIRIISALSGPVLSTLLVILFYLFIYRKWGLEFIKYTSGGIIFFILLGAMDDLRVAYGWEENTLKLYRILVVVFFPLAIYALIILHSWWKSRKKS